MKKTCNQCGQEMKLSILKLEDEGEPRVMVCTNPACANFALLQIAVEDLKKPI